MGHVTIIAEIGSSPAPAWDFTPWCAAAASAGADAVKVQLFRAEHFPAAEQASKRALEFPRERLSELADIARTYGLGVGASVFDDDAVKLAFEHCDFVKLAARESANARLRHACQEQAIYKMNAVIYRSVDGIEWSPKHHEITLYAVQQYPSEIEYSIECLLLADYCYKNQKYGWSSHTTSTLDCILAARLGATVIEKHLALSASDLEAGHSLQPAQFAAMCRAIRKGER